MGERIHIHYKTNATGKLFHNSNAFVRGVMGPVRSGKSTMMSAEIFRRMREQAPTFGKFRESRWIIVRNTYRELEDTTLKTWLNWWPQDVFGKFNYNTMVHNFRYNDVAAEVLFRALDRPDDVRKMLSLELTGGWINEAREIPKAIVDTLTDRVGQYPAKKDGGCTWYGVMMDTNLPDDDHWWYIAAEEDRPIGWQFFRQPGALIERGDKFIANPKAENVEHLNEGIRYYLKRVPGKSKDYIRVYYCGQYGFVIEGKPVHPDYVDATHCPGIDLNAVKRWRHIIGLDFGLTPAAAFIQEDPRGRYEIHDELVTFDMGAKRFGELLGKKLRGEYNEFKFEIWGDPAGDDRAQTDEETVYQVLHASGIDAKPVWTNDTTIRREALAAPLRRMVDGKPGITVSPKAKVIRKGLAGGFAYKRVQVVGQERYHDKPDKNKYSHPVEACEYAMVGAGEGRKLIESDYIQKDEDIKIVTEYDEFDY